MEQYEAQMQATTKYEKARLFASEEYKAAVRRKGWRQAAWNWQTREREQAQGINVDEFKEGVLEDKNKKGQNTGTDVQYPNMTKFYDDLQQLRQ